MIPTITPADDQKIFEMIVVLIANYRDGQGSPAFLPQVEALSAEWERQKLPCFNGLEAHGRRERDITLDLKKIMGTIQTV